MATPLEAFSKAQELLTQYGAQPRCFLEVNLSNLRQNIRTIMEKAKATQCSYMMVLKANAYGVGAARAASVALEEGVDAFAVATIEEALQLRLLNLKTREEGKEPLILCLGAAHPSEFLAYAKHHIDLMINSPEAMQHVLEWSRNDAAAKKKRQPIEAMQHVLEKAKNHASAVRHGEKKQRPIACHVMLDTGMNRLGLETKRPDQLASTVQSIVEFSRVAQETAGVSFAGLCTHMAEAAVGVDFSEKQAVQFTKVFQAVQEAGVPVPSFHMENSTCLMEDLLPDRQIVEDLVHGGSLRNKNRSKGYVRIGTANYGNYFGPSSPQLIQPVMRFVAQIRHIGVVEKGEGVSYDQTYKAPEQSLIATLGVGYADGYPRSLSNQGLVQINNKLYPVAGRVCMDMMMINLGPLDGEGSKVAVGDHAVLALTSPCATCAETASDEHGPDWQWLGNNAGSLSLECMCRITKRVKRIYIN